MKRYSLFAISIKILILCAFGTLIYLAFRPNYEKLRQLQLQQSLLTQRLILKEKQSQCLKKELTGLNSNSSWIEKVAREKLGWCLPEEKIYRFQTPDSNH